MMSSSRRREQYYYYQHYLLVMAVMALFGCRQQTFVSSNHIFVNNIVPLISSNLSASSAISIDNSSKVPSPSTPSVPVFPFVPMAPVIQAQQSQQQPGNERDFSIQELTKSLEMKLKRIRNQELDVPVVQELYDTMEFTSVIRNDIEELEKMAKKLTVKFEQSAAVIDRLRAFIYDSATRHSAKYNTIINPCPYSELINPWDDEPQFDLQNFIQNTKLMNSSNALKQFSGESGFLDFSAFPASPDDRPRIRITDQTVEDNNQSLQKRFLDQIAHLQSNFYSLKQLFYLSSFDQASAFKCHYYPKDGRLKSLYLSSVRNKHFMILLDIGNSVSFDQLEVAKAIVKFMIYLLNENDRIAIVAVSQKLTTTESLLDCANGPFVNATVDNKDRLVDFVDSLNKTSSAATHVSAIRYAFKAIGDVYHGVETELPVVFLYLGRAQLSPITAAAKRRFNSFAELSWFAQFNQGQIVLVGLMIILLMDVDGLDITELSTHHQPFASEEDTQCFHGILRLAIEQAVRSSQHESLMHQDTSAVQLTLVGHRHLIRKLALLGELSINDGLGAPNQSGYQQDEHLHHSSFSTFDHLIRS